MPQFLDPLVVQEIDDSVFQTVKVFRYQSDIAGLLTVPALFYTDFASVPRLGIIYAMLGNCAHEPAVIHDWIYFSAVVDRKIGDDVFLEAMGVIGIPAWKKKLIYWGVRLGGMHAWNKHRKDGHPETGKFANSPDIKEK